MRKINIQITKAVISAFNVELNDSGLPDVSATINLFTSNGKKVSSFTATTKQYCSVLFELPPEMIPAIVDIASRLETTLTRTCNKELCLLECKE